ncbi:MAG: MBOAT family protein [Butyrivibrio sp.]|nr:MBOAT family protein [Butyrivibrio sp.]
MVNFSDLNFIFRFLPVFLIVFYITPMKFRTWTLVIGSLLFYAMGDLRMLPALFGAIVVNFLFAKAIREEKSWSLLLFILLIDAGMLVEFKILGQFVDSSLLPIGISFYIFKMISFQLDVYTDRFKDEATFIDVAAYFSMFPQIVSGPIMRFEQYKENSMLEKDLEYRPSIHVILTVIEDGLRYFVAGFAMKVLLADRLSMLWRDIGTIGYESISTPLAWLGAVTYSLQLYFDFWGYSLMAAGIGVMLGFPFIENFKQPYSSKNVAEFYRRWHATLGSWFRDYIYFPMGGSRKGDKRTVFNLLVVWLLTGFWHGITPNFILWGVSLFAIIVCERFFVYKKFQGKAAAIVGRFNVLVLIPLTWVVFAISDFGMLTTYFTRLFPFFGEGIAVNRNDFLKNIGLYWPVLVPALVLLIPQIFDYFEKNRTKPVFTVLLLLLFWGCVYVVAGTAGSPFVYMRF